MLCGDTGPRRAVQQRVELGDDPAVHGIHEVHDGLHVAEETGQTRAPRQ
jgi:hypothetical protein